MDGAGGGDSGGYGSPSAKMVEPDLNIPPISEYLAALQDKKQQQKQQQANGGDSALQQNQQQKHNNIDHQNGGEQLFGQNGEMLDGNNHQSSHHKQQQQHLLMSQLKTEGLDESGWPNGAPPPPNAVGGGMSQQQAFLRGRGRGRPKLIGDELDAELVEWMVMVRKSLTKMAGV